MIRTLLTGLPVMLLCMFLQVLFVILCLRQYVSFRNSHPDPNLMQQAVILSAVMLLALVGNCLQMSIWATLFLLLGEFSDYQTALYHSTVNFVTLGYGDMVMSPRWRMLGPIEGANGILMFGLSTALMTATTVDLLKGRPVAVKMREGP
jgi:hypothetical protein